jgi:hypothetical protein
MQHESIADQRDLTKEEYQKYVDQAIKKLDDDLISDIANICAEYCVATQKNKKMTIGNPFTISAFDRTTPTYSLF